MGNSKPREPDDIGTSYEFLCVASKDGYGPHAKSGNCIHSVMLFRKNIVSGKEDWMTVVIEDPAFPKEPTRERSLLIAEKKLREKLRNLKSELSLHIIVSHNPNKFFKLLDVEQMFGDPIKIEDSNPA